MDRVVQERFPATCLAPGTRLRVDNMPAYGSDAILEHARLLGLRVEHIQKSTAEDNGVVESFHAGLARDYLNALVFDSFTEPAWLRHTPSCAVRLTRAQLLHSSKGNTATPGWQTEMTQLTVVVVNHNGRSFAEANLRSIMDQTLTKFEVRWADSGSRDDSVKVARQLADNRVRFVLYGENVGPVRAMFDAAREESAEYLLFLNVATVLSQDCLERLLGFAVGKGERFGGCFPKMLHYDPPFLPYLIGCGSPTPRQRLFEDLMTFVNGSMAAIPGKVDPSSTSPVSTSSFWGLSCLLSTKMLRRVGIDLNLFNYGEEEDISLRARRLGYEFFYVPETWIRYKVGAVTKSSRFNPSPVRSYLGLRNELYLSMKHLEHGTRGSVIPWIVLRHALRGLAKPSSWKWQLKALAWVIRNIQSIRSEGAYPDCAGTTGTASTFPDENLACLLDTL